MTDLCEYIIQWDDRKPLTCGEAAMFFRKSAMGNRIRLCRDHALRVPCDQLEPIDRVDPNDCAGCGDRPAVRDEDGEFTYPRYTHQGRPPVGVCGWCEREGIPV